MKLFSFLLFLLRQRAARPVCVICYSYLYSSPLFRLSGCSFRSCCLVIFPFLFVAVAVAAAAVVVVLLLLLFISLNLANFQFHLLVSKLFLAVCVSLLLCFAKNHIICPLIIIFSLILFPHPLLTSSCAISFVSLLSPSLTFHHSSHAPFPFCLDVYLCSYVHTSFLFIHVSIFAKICYIDECYYSSLSLFLSSLLLLLLLLLLPPLLVLFGDILLLFSYFTETLDFTSRSSMVSLNSL